MSSATGSVPAGHAQPDPLRDPRVASPTERTRRALILTALTLLVPGDELGAAGSAAWRCGSPPPCGPC